MLALRFAFIFEQGDGDGEFFAAYAALVRAEQVDLGGIAGLNTSVIKYCDNYGDVGYPHTGYNVGGIAGRQSGRILGCTNAAEVTARKDVGGIVGQVEPYTSWNVTGTGLGPSLIHI